ncbi:MAG: phage portal protein [Planctomycetota bacterium]
MPSSATPSTINAALRDLLLREHTRQTRPRLERLWNYYRNPSSVDHRGTAADHVHSASRCAQARGLPARLTHGSAQNPREIVIENDIAWRIHTLVDFMFGKPLVIQSLADDPAKRTAITQLLRNAFRANGGEGFFHDLALLGSIYGYIDIVARPRHQSLANSSSAPTDWIQLDLIEAPRAVPVLDPGDYRLLDAYLIHQPQLSHDLEQPAFLNRLLRKPSTTSRKTVERTEVWTAESFETFVSHQAVTGKRQTRIDGGINRLGRLPVVHIQNLAQPFFYEGLSDVEPLIPLQDELNTRLSDRANRVTFQSFKMYLGKGIDGFTDRPVGPGQMWSTDNPDAAIHEFGGDASTPSEDQHIREIREALDKASGVSPIAAGVVGGKTGNLSSENAIRIVLLGLLARIEKKRLTYGTGIEQLCELILHAADVTGVLPNTPDERRVRLDWPTPFPDSEAQQLENALTKKELGVPTDQLLAELGYSECVDHG